LSLLDFATHYFSAPWVLLLLASVYCSIGVLFIGFRAQGYRPKVRSRVLLAIFGLASSSWIFIASSLVFCQVFKSLYYSDEGSAIVTVLGFSTLSTLVLGLPISLIMATKLPSLVVRRLERDLVAPSASLSRLIGSMASTLGVERVALYESTAGTPSAYSLGGPKNIVVISTSLEESLDKDELETVLMHELAHLSNKDTQINAIVHVYRKMLFFDPLIRLIEKAIHKEREFACDEVSAKLTRKPLALASALIKIHSRVSQTEKPAFLAGSIILLGRNTLRERIERLVRISQELEHQKGQ